MEVIAHYIHESGSAIVIQDASDNSIERIALWTLANLFLLLPKPRPEWTLVTTLNHWGIKNDDTDTFTSSVDFERAKVKKLAWAAQFAKDNWYVLFTEKHP